MPYSATIIAYAFVKKGIESGNPVTQMKLQKLIYFAHGLHLATYNKPLIQETFQAWKFGPVVPSVYQDYKLYGSMPIAATDYLFFFKDASVFDKELTLLDNEAQTSIKITWDALKDTSASRLSNWTHKANSPWTENYEEGVNDTPIPNDEIKEYFKAHIIKN